MSQTLFKMIYQLENLTQKFVGFKYSPVSIIIIEIFLIKLIMKKNVTFLFSAWQHQLQTNVYLFYSYKTKFVLLYPKAKNIRMR